MTTLIAYGTRPEWLKLKPIIDEFTQRNTYHNILQIKQHKQLTADQNSYSDISLDIMDMENVDRLTWLLGDILAQDWASTILKGVKLVIIQGDTTSALGVALAAFNCKVPIAHIEAGLRTYDLASPFPEEANRQLISRLATYHFCPTTQAQLNLVGERVCDTNTYVVGNTILDLVKSYNLDPPTHGEGMLVTMHRRENQSTMDQWLFTIDQIAGYYNGIHDVTVVKHPAISNRLYNSLRNVKVVEPMNHKDLCKMIASSFLVITDSGGLQEEAAFLRRKTIVCRKDTERKEGLGVFSLLASSPKLIQDCINLWMVRSLSNDKEHMRLYTDPCPYGDGTAANKITDILQEGVLQ